MANVYQPVKIIFQHAENRGERVGNAGWRHGNGCEMLSIPASSALLVYRGSNQRRGLRGVCPYYVGPEILTTHRHRGMARKK